MTTVFSFYAFEFITLDDDTLTDRFGPGEIVCWSRIWDKNLMEYVDQKSVVANLFVAVHDRVRDKMIWCVVVPAHLRATSAQCDQIDQNITSICEVRKAIESDSSWTSDRFFIHNESEEIHAMRGPPMLVYGKFGDDTVETPNAYVRDMCLLEMDVHQKPQLQDHLRRVMKEVQLTTLTDLMQGIKTMHYKIGPILKVTTDHLREMAERKTYILVGSEIGYVLEPIRNLGCRRDRHYLQHIRFITLRHG